MVADEHRLVVERIGALGAKRRRLAAAAAAAIIGLAGDLLLVVVVAAVVVGLVVVADLEADLFVGGERAVAGQREPIAMIENDRGQRVQVVLVESHVESGEKVERILVALASLLLLLLPLLLLPASGGHDGIVAKVGVGELELANGQLADEELVAARVAVVLEVVERLGGEDHKVDLVELLAVVAVHGHHRALERQLPLQLARPLVHAHDRAVRARREVIERIVALIAAAAAGAAGRRLFGLSDARVHAGLYGLCGVVVVGEIEDLLARVHVEHADDVLGAADVDDVLVGQRDLCGERLGGERVELVAVAVVDGQPLVLLVAREQVAVGGLGGRGRHQLGYRVRILLEAVAAIREYVQAAVDGIDDKIRTAQHTNENKLCQLQKLRR